jgi:serine/threonine-protein kinase
MAVGEAVAMNTDRFQTVSPEWDLDTPLVGGVRVCPTCGDLFSSMCERCPDDSTLLEPELVHPDPMVGSVLDNRFRILRPLAEGSMGRVYEGVQLPNKRPVAIKIIREELVRDPVAAHRFLREVRTLMRITHPNIVEVIDYGEQDGCLFFVMELLRGNSLDVILAAEGPFSVRRTCEIGIQLCDALVSAHGKAVVHRDLKPANIVMLAGTGDWIKVLDFGLAKRLGADSDEVTFTGTVPGTPLYMSPEAVRCETVGPRGDLYAVGCILFELLTGAPPFLGESSAMVLVRQLDDEPPPLPLSVPAPLRELIARLLAKRVADRPDSAYEVRCHLQARLAAELDGD